MVETACQARAVPAEERCRLAGVRLALYARQVAPAANPIPLKRFLPCGGSTTANRHASAVACRPGRVAAAIWHGGQGIGLNSRLPLFCVNPASCPGRTLKGEDSLMLVLLKTSMTKAKTIGKRLATHAGIT